MVALPKGYKLEKAILGSECVSTDKPGVYELALDPEDVAVWKLEKQAVGKRPQRAAFGEVKLLYLLRVIVF